VYTSMLPGAMVALPWAATSYPAGTVKNVASGGMKSGCRHADSFSIGTDAGIGAAWSRPGRRVSP